MSLSEAKRKANDKYIRNNYDRIAVNYPKAYCEKVREAAKARGETLAGFVKRAIDARIADDAENPPDPDIVPVETE